MLGRTKVQAAAFVLVLGWAVVTATAWAQQRSVRPRSVAAPISVTRVGDAGETRLETEPGLVALATKKHKSMGFRQVEALFRARVPKAELDALKVQGLVQPPATGSGPPSSQPFSSEEGVVLRPFSKPVWMNGPMEFGRLGAFHVSTGPSQSVFLRTQAAGDFAVIPGAKEKTFTIRFHPNHESDADTASKTFILKLEATGLPANLMIRINNVGTQLNLVGDGTYACMFSAQANITVGIPLAGVQFLRFHSIAVKRFTY